jgi:pimeloyl-ACP methyl ester carboxylesterase
MSPSEAFAFPKFKTEAGEARFLAAYEAALAQWPVPCEEIDVPTRLGPAHVIASGPKDAPPLVLLPGFAGTALVWRLNVEALSRHFRVYALDVVGQPGRSPARRRLRSRRDYADWLAQVLDGLGAPSASIVGASFGGFLALSQAILTPERVGKVVMIGPAGSFVGLSWRFAVAMRTAGLRRRIRRWLGDRRPPDIANVVPRPPRDGAWRALIGVVMSEAPKLSVINAPVFSRRELGRVKAPVLLLIGEEEQLYQAAPTLELARRRLPGLQGAVVPDADHLAAMAQPDEVGRRIIEFLLA